MGPPPDILSYVLWNLGYSLCHQIPERSFFIDGYQLPMCARDTGTFIGFLIVFLYGILRKRYLYSALPDRYSIAATIIGFILYVFDGLSSYVGIRDTTNAFRLTTGLMLGAGIGFFSITLFSFILLNRRTKERAFTWSDIPVVYPVLLLAGLFIYFINKWLVFYYVVSTAMIVGYLLLFFIMINVVIAIFRDRNYTVVRDRWQLVVTSLLAEAGLIAFLWLVHRWTSALVPLH